MMVNSGIHVEEPGHACVHFPAPAGDANGAAMIRSRPGRDLHIPQDTTRAEQQIAEKQVLTWWHV